MRAWCVTIRDFPDPLGIVTAEKEAQQEKMAFAGIRNKNLKSV